LGEAVFAVDACLWESVPWEAVVSLLSPRERRLAPLAAARRLLEVDTRHKMGNVSDAIFDQVAPYERLAATLEANRRVDRD